MKYDIDAFYENMQNAIIERGIIYKEIYNFLGMRQSNFSNAFHRKNGKRFTLEQMLSIAEFLNCSLDEMFTTEKERIGAQYLKIPEMSKWTCSDLLRLLFALRKSEGNLNFADTKVIEYPFMEEVEVTTIYFTKRFILDSFPFTTDNGDMLINSVIREWAQIIKSTENIDSESRELMLSKWEEKKLEQHKNLMLSKDMVTYDMDRITKQFIRKN